MLLIRTLKASTLKLALVCVVLFSAAVFALLGYVYWATMDYARGRADRAISAKRALLVHAYGGPVGTGSSVSSANALSRKTSKMASTCFPIDRPSFLPAI